MIEKNIPLKKISASLYGFLVSLLQEIPKISPLSSQEKIEYWINNQSFLQIEPEIQDEKKQEDKIGISSYLSSDVLSLDYFYQADKFSYHSLPSKILSLLSEKKEQDAFIEVIKISHLSVEAGQILFLLVQHMQILWVVNNMHSSAEKNNCMFVADLFWYRSALWCLVHSISICKYFFRVYKSDFYLSTVNLAPPAKIKSMFIQHCANASWSEAKENYLLLACMADFFSKNIKPIRRDYLSWFDDLHEYVLNSDEKYFLPLTRINKMKHISTMFQSKLHYEVARYFASILVKMGVFLFVMIAMTFPCDNSVQLNNFSILFPLIDFMKLQLCSWFLIPILAGVLKIAILQPISNNYLRAHKNNFEQSCAGIMQTIQRRYDQLCENNDDWPVSNDKINKMNLLDDAITTLHLKLKKPHQSGGIYQRCEQASSFLQHILYHFACMACSIVGTVMIFLLMLVPQNYCKRLHEVKKGYLESLDSPRLSNSLFGMFAAKKEAKDSKSLPILRVRAPIFLSN